jgi:hypothetical protein
VDSQDDEDIVER